jgi:AraC-like DNA-binding protein
MFQTTYNTILTYSCNFLVIFDLFSTMTKPIIVNTAPQSNQIITVKRYIGDSFPLPFHMHKKYELTLIVAGSGTRIIGDNIDRFESGDVVFTAPMIPHQWQTPSLVNNSQVEAISIFFDEHFPTPDFQKLPEFQNILQLLEQSKKGILLKGSLKSRIAENIPKLESMENMQLLMNIFGFLIDIAESQEYELLSSEHYIINHNFDTDRISVISNYINKHIDKKINISDLASLVNLHPGSLSCEFRKLTGYTIVEYINRIRIGMATRLLDQSNQAIINIAFECGFQNLSHFNRVFKRIKMLTPSEYRLKRRGVKP